MKDHKKGWEQSIEQSDVYGNNETCYLPPLEAVVRIEMVKGDAAFQSGSRMDGMMNYLLKINGRSVLIQTV